jgi:two-component system OmpR family response regulator/two-component system alkaline phosphatase synthesis response regulator PhoP
MKYILIVEDDPKMQKLYQEALGRQNFEVLIAANVTQASGTLQNRIPDLIVLDIMLPGGKNGFDFLEEIRRKPETKHVKVLVVTALDTERETAEKIGVSGYIVKPHSSLDKIVEEIVNLLK